MPRNGSGVYSLPAGNPVVTGTVISSVVQNNTTSDMATAFTQSLASDGQTTPTANIPMGTFRITGLGAATTTTDAARADQVQNSSLLALSSVSGTDTITATAPISVAAYAAGQIFNFIPANNNTAAVTININSIGAKAITKEGTTALGADDLVAGRVHYIRYDTTGSTQFQLLNYGTASVLPVADTQTIVKGSADPTKLLRFEIDGFTAGATRVVTPPDKNGTMAMTSDIIPITIIDAAGDLIVGTAADTAARLAMGTALQVPRVNSGATALEYATPIFSKSYTSAQQTIAQAGAGSSPLAHGLGAVPLFVTLELVCTDAGGEAGYAQNDVVQMLALDYTANQGVAILKDATNLTIRFGNNANVFSIAHATTGTATVLTNSKWAAVFRAYA